MEDQLNTDNQTVADGTPDNNGAVDDIGTIMGGMTSEQSPDAKAEISDKADGNGEGEKTDAKAEIPAWMQQLPEEMRNDSNLTKQLAKFQKIGDMAKSYSELESKLGKSLIQPSDDASDEEKEAFYQKLGKPASAADYGLKGDDEVSKSFIEAAFKNNLTKAQAKGIYDTLNLIGAQTAAAMQNKIKEQSAATTAELKAEYGKDYASAVEFLKRGINAYGGKELGDKLTKSGLIADKSIVKMFIQLGKQSSEAGSSTKAAGSGNDYKDTRSGGHFSFKYD